MVSRVSFLVVGVQKGGTSAMRNHLRQVPGIVMPPGEPHFFDNARLSHRPTGMAAYEELFSGEGLCGEVTPNYCYWPGTFERIARYNPEMKIIMLLRDRAERAWSQWRMQTRKGQETAPFAWAIREGRGRVVEAPGSRHGAHRLYSYVERGFYAPPIRRAFGLFGRERVLLISSSNLRGRPAETMQTVSQFLGVSITGEALLGRTVNQGADHHAGRGMSEEDAAFLGAIYAEDLAEVARLTAA